MTTRVRARVRRGPAALILLLFLLSVAGAAAAGWWYARESPPHQGPILLVSIDGIAAVNLTAYGAVRTDTPALDALAAESVIFERAYTHSPLSLPAHASLLSGLLPPEHGVRDDAGFTLALEVQTLAELLANRGFATGAAVSSFLLRRRSGLAQGFTFFDDEFSTAGSDLPRIERAGTLTADAAVQWMSKQDDRRFFLFVQVSASEADAALMRLSSALKNRDLYDEASVLVIGDRGDPVPALTLDERSLRIPFLVKQPWGEGGGRRVRLPVQSIDVLPTILDLVRAPAPDRLLGRSLRPLLDEDGDGFPEQPIYSESLEAYYRLGGRPTYALTGPHFRYVRDSASEDLVPLDAQEAGGESTEAARLRGHLDRLLAASPLVQPAPIPASEEDRYALLGYLGPGLEPETDSVLDADSQRKLVESHRAAVALIGQKKYSAGIRALQAIAREQPALASLRYQAGVLLARSGRLEEATREFEAVERLRPESVIAARALADALLQAGHTEEAVEQAAIAVALAEHQGARALFLAHETAARVAIADRDAEAATRHAEAAKAADPAMPIPQFVEGRLLYEARRFEEAAEVLAEAVSVVERQQRTLPDLHLYLGEALVRLDRDADAEAQFHEELVDHPRNIRAYTNLAMLYRADNRNDAVEDVLDNLVAATPTPEGYGVAAGLWTILGDPSRAEALRSDARTRFRDDPSLALLGRDRLRPRAD